MIRIFANYYSGHKVVKILFSLISSYPGIYKQKKLELLKMNKHLNPVNDGLLRTTKDVTKSTSLHRADYSVSFA